MDSWHQIYRWVAHHGVFLEMVFRLLGIAIGKKKDTKRSWLVFQLAPSPRSKIPISWQQASLGAYLLVKNTKGY